MGTIPDWCEALPDAETMREIDRWAIQEQGTPSLDLMERAGIALARAAEQITPDGPILILAGKGNNGGDGLVAARQLREAGRHVEVLCTSAPEEFSGDAHENLKRLPGEPPLTLQADQRSDGLLANAALIIDALLGTGFDGSPRGMVALAIERILRSQAPVLSADIPSGVDASSGAVAGIAVTASVTVSFHAAKPGLWINPGKKHSGEVRLADIGIPRGAPCEADVLLIGAAVASQLPGRESSSTKFSSGHVVIAGGSPGLMGAPGIAALASMRAGAGYITACVPASQTALIDSHSLEVMTRALPEQDGELAAEAVSVVEDALKQGSALALGPGLGRAPASIAFARELAASAACPLVLDADGLNAHEGALDELSARTSPTVLTPHAGELGRLLEISSADVQRERLRHVRAAAERSGAVVVLKGDDTLIAEPTGRVAVSRGASPALATAGTGDALTGVICALLAQGLDTFTAACAGVWLHAQAGRVAAHRQGSAASVIATDVIAALGAARGEGHST